MEAMIKSQTAAKDACTKILAEIEEWGAVETWSVQRYDQAYKIMMFADGTHLAEDDRVGGAAVFERLSALVSAFERAEGVRRARVRYERERAALQERIGETSARSNGFCDFDVKNASGKNKYTAIKKLNQPDQKASSQFDCCRRKIIITRM